MTEYYIPTGPSETEFVEKRSRFITHLWPVETEEEIFIPDEVSEEVEEIPAAPKAKEFKIPELSMPVMGLIAALAVAMSMIPGLSVFSFLF